MSTTHHNYVIWDFVGHDQSLVATHIITCIQGLFLLSHLASDLLPCSVLVSLDISPSQGVSSVYLYQFLYPSSVSFQTWKFLPNQGSSGLRKRRLYCDIPILKADSVPGNVNDFHRHTHPQKGNKGRMEEIIRNEFGHTVSSLLFVFRSVELVKASVNSWNFQALKLPDVFKLSLKNAYFYNVYFFWEEEKNRVGLVRGITGT